MIHLQKGDIVYVDMGSEETASHTQRGWRPVIVLDFFPANKSCIVIPFTSQDKKDIPTHVHVDKNDIPVLNGRNTILCENCTMVCMSGTTQYDKLPYNIYRQNYAIWKKIIHGLSVQLSRNFDYCSSKVVPSFRRGSIIHIKNDDDWVIVVSNNKNNEFSENLTVASLLNNRNGKLNEMQNNELYGNVTVLLINIPKTDVLDNVGYDRNMANQISKAYLNHIK